MSYGYARYDFFADIITNNISLHTANSIKCLCTRFFKEEQEKRRTKRHWTSHTVVYYEPVASNSTQGLIRFEIKDANSVKALKHIEGKLQEALSQKPYHGSILGISCKHVRTHP